MKKYIRNILFIGLLASCSLDKDPISDFSEVTIGGSSAGEGYATKAEMQTQYDAIYTLVKNNMQESWMLDIFAHAEIRSDNAYAGSTGAIAFLEDHGQDATHSIVLRDWNFYLRGINTANIVIANVDEVPDAALTVTERVQWKAEAMIFKAWLLFDMVRLWGDLPIPPIEVPEITSSNVEETYAQLFPPRTPTAQVYDEIIENLEYGRVNAPGINTADKFLFSKTVAKALLAKVYAEKPKRDYAKTIQYCTEVEADGVTLVSDFSDLFGFDTATMDVRARHTSESIFEIAYDAGGSNWLWMMFGKNAANPASTYAWSKWVTPSRDIIAAFDAEGDTVRKGESILQDAVSWSNYYPGDQYQFMYKVRSSLNSVIKLRLADILLLKAEAYAATGDLQSAAALVNQIRARVHLPALASSITADQDAMKGAVLNERRLELAFEGHRWFDLVRNDKAIEVMNSLNSRDSGRLPMRRTIDENALLYPVPLSEIEKNPNLVQNAGY
ncbi:MAG: RagB/SusD family nutrient uptake outer membrane protein [Capnocytophaga sp.]|nr:RagB/SusD family nutrient uptake outer membrane protein [Capnocytophaga sp.]